MPAPSEKPSCLSRGNKPAGYDLSLEILCTIPPARPTPLRQLAQDFRLATDEAIEAIRGLREYGVTLIAAVHELDGVTKVFIPAHCKMDVRRVGEAYWTHVYESARSIKRAAMN